MSTFQMLPSIPLHDLRSLVVAFEEKDENTAMKELAAIQERIWKNYGHMRGGSFPQGTAVLTGPAPAVCTQQLINEMEGIITDSQEHPVSYVAASLLLLQLQGIHARNPAFKFGIASHHVQERLSWVLTTYPVLMSPDFVFGTLSPDGSQAWAPVAHAIVNTPLAQLPSVYNGATRDAAEAFYRHPCLEDALYQECPCDESAPGPFEGRDAYRFARDNLYAGGWPRTALAVSLLRAQHESSGMLAHETYPVAQYGALCTTIFETTRVIHYDLMAAGDYSYADIEHHTASLGDLPGVARARLVEALALTAPSWLLTAPFARVPDDVLVEPGHDDVQSRIECFITVMCAVDLFSSRDQVASWLCHATFDKARTLGVNVGEVLKPEQALVIVEMADRFFIPATADIKELPAFAAAYATWEASEAMTSIIKHDGESPSVGSSPRPA